MVEYFIWGLRSKLQDAVAPLMCRTVEEAAQRAAVLERTLQARQSQSQARGSGSFRLPQQSQGISKGKAPSGASSSGIAKWGKQIKKFFQGGGRGRGRQWGFQQECLHRFRVRCGPAGWPELLVCSLSLNATEGCVAFSSRYPGTSCSGCCCFGSSSADASRVARGAGVLTSTGGSRRAATSQPGRDVAIRRVPNRAVFLRNPSRTELSQAQLGQGRFCSWDSGRFELVGLGWTCSRREDHVWSGRNVGLSPIFVFFIKVGRFYPFLCGFRGCVVCEP
ncbi:hypothetical protein Taro_049378 [Colocasia esculenta]|uniref:Uncharacterized protein n=1 Tax=Colocasia esculenta TaxID=4460 RepID=A0A843XAU2_COLES|nr:hypothetical protein [Colocasia esculenta]